MILILIISYEKSYENTLIYECDVPCKTSYDTKRSNIIFDKVNGYIWNFDETSYLALLHSNEKFEKNFIELDILLC